MGKEEFSLTGKSAFCKVTILLKAFDDVLWFISVFSSAVPTPPNHKRHCKQQNSMPHRRQNAGFA